MEKLGHHSLIEGCWCSTIRGLVGVVVFLALLTVVHGWALAPGIPHTVGSQQAAPEVLKLEWEESYYALLNHSFTDGLLDCFQCFHHYKLPRCLYT